MAVTSIWPVKGRVGTVIDYARNPEKTTKSGCDTQAALHAIDGVLEYAADEMKTERRAYVSCLNCREDTAAEQFMETKRMWDNLGGRMCYHAYQSFKAEEVTAGAAHEIGVKLAEELWGDRFEVLIATHCNTGHYHNHFVINSVSWADGRKFYNSPADYARMREVSDRLCRAYRLSVIEHPQGHRRNYGEWKAEQAGKPTHRGTIRADIDRAILASTTERGFIRVMTEMGYELKTRRENGMPLKCPALKPPGAKGYFRFHKLGTGYTLEEIRQRILRNIQKQIPFPEEERRPPRPCRMRGSLKRAKKITGLRALYYRYCYELHILVKRPASASSPQSPLSFVSAFGENCARSLAAPLPTKSSTLRGPRSVSFLLREDIAKLDRLDAETRYLGKNAITTIAELTGRREAAEAELSALTAQRHERRNELRRLERSGNAAAADGVRAEIGKLSQKIKALRKEIALCEGIAERSTRVRDNLEQMIKEKHVERDRQARGPQSHQRGETRRANTPNGR